MRKPIYIAAMFASLLVSGCVVEPGVGLHMGMHHGPVYGQIEIYDEAPLLIYPQPVIITPGPPGLAPIYLHVRPGYERDWGRYCHEYNACNRPVYFVRESWYNEVYEPRYRRGRGPVERRDNYRDRDERRDEYRDRREEGGLNQFRRQEQPQGRNYDNSSGSSLGGLNQFRRQEQPQSRSNDTPRSEEAPRRYEAPRNEEAPRRYEAPRSSQGGLGQFRRPEARGNDNAGSGSGNRGRGRGRGRDDD